MVAVASAFFLEGAGSTKISISQDNLRSLLGQIEAELHRSDVYQRALTGVQKSVEDVAENTQALIKAVGREAIRLALRQFIKQYQANPSAPGTPHTDGQSSVSSPLKAESSVVEIHSSVPGVTQTQPSWEGKSLSNPVTYDEPEKEIVQLPPSPAQKVADTPVGRPTVHQSQRTTRPGAPSNPIAQKRAALLQQIGTELAHIRQEKAISLEQLHTQTWVPVHLIRALESGDVERLPEDIYIRGFIRRIGDALGADGTNLADTLLVVDQSKNVIPSWQQRSLDPSMLRPVHLYLSYAALMAGALGGLAWMAHQSAEVNQLSLQPLPDLSSGSALQADSHSNAQSSVTQKTIQPTQQTGAIATPETTHPETSWF